MNYISENCKINIGRSISPLSLIMNNPRRNKESDSMHNSVKKIQTFGSQFNQGGKRPVFWKQQNITE